MLAEILTIGDEILIGQIVDTNSAWIAQQLNSIGVAVKQISSISDNRIHILEALAEAAGRADIIIITGGLGPTKDDITKKTLAEYFRVGLRQDQESLAVIEKIFAKYNRPLLEINIRQADVPENCTVLLNKNGTAPGMWFEYEGKIFISLPGVPFEMMYLVEEEVLPRLKSHFTLPVIIHKTLLTAGVGESFLAEMIADIEDSLPKHIKLAYLPNLGQVRLRLSGYGAGGDTLEEEINFYRSRLAERTSEFLVTDIDKPLEKAVLDIMEAKGMSLATAESCTGGYIAHLLTRNAGSSKVFRGGAVTYSNDLKQSMVGVSESTLRNFGAVSEETVREMAAGAIKNFKSDHSIAVSGIAGPDGGTKEKPVGTVWIAVANRDKIKTKKFQFGNRRIQNIERSAINAFIMLLGLIKEHE